MTETLLQMAVLIACGCVWRYLRPGGLTAEQVRPVLTSVVYYLFLPAMVLDVLWHSEIGQQSIQYTFLGVASILVAMLIMWLVGLAFRFGNKTMGAVMLAAAFPNVTYLGLPVLEQTFGAWARSVAIQIDLFATGPLVFTLGIVVSRHFGENQADNHRSVISFLNAPPFWAALIAAILSLNHIAMPGWLAGILQKLSAGVVPLMLFSLGLALNWSTITWRNLPFVLPVVVIKMALMPLFSLWLVGYLWLDHDHKAAAVLEMAMPCMVIGIIFCDRYRLDSGLYAMIVTLTTLLSLFTLPFWYGVLTR
jgi:malate permease and related proteins